jgi:hypothetical protein
MTVEEVSAKPAPPQCDKKRSFRDVCVRVDVPNSARVGGCSLIASSKHRVIFTHCIASQQLSVSNLGQIEGTARVAEVADSSFTYQFQREGIPSAVGRGRDSYALAHALGCEHRVDPEFLHARETSLAKLTSADNRPFGGLGESW